MSGVPTSEGPAFTIITPALNAERWIAEAIDSVLAQTRTDWEMVIVDNGSADATAARVEPYLSDPRLRLIRAPENRTPAHWRNELAVEARGRYLVNLDADDRLLPGFLAETGRILDGRPDVAVVAVNAQLIEGAAARLLPGTMMEAPWWRRPRKKGPESMLEALLERVFIYAGSPMRRSEYLRLGGFDVSLFGCMDWDLWIRIAASGGEIIVLETPLAVYRVHGGSLSRPSHDRANERFLANVELMIDRTLATIPLSEREAQVARGTKARVRSNRLMAAARVALVEGENRAAQRSGREALRTRPGLRTFAIVGLLHLAPGRLRELHLRRLDRAARSGVALGFRSEPVWSALLRRLRRG